MGSFKIHMLIIWVAIVTALPAHAERLVTLTPTPAPSVTQSYDKGNVVMASTAAQSSVRLVGVKLATENRRARFRVTVENRLATAIDISPQTVGAINDKGTIIGALTPQDLYQVGDKLIARRVWISALASGLSAAATSSTQTVTTDVNLTASSRYGTTDIYGQAKTTMPVDPATVQAAKEAEDRRDASFKQRVNDARAQMRKASDENGLISQTVQPGATYTTPFVLDALPRKTRTVTISVRVGGDVHQFPFSVSE